MKSLLRRFKSELLLRTELPRTQWALLYKSFSTYLRIYGGWRALCSSAYLAIAIVMTALCFPLWTNPGWWDDVLSVSPSVLGFSLGGYAILLAFGSDDFRTLSAGELDNKPSPWMELSAAFVHFIVIQLFGLVLALIAKGRPFSAMGLEDFSSRVWITTSCWALGFLVFAYGLVLVLASTFRILDVTHAFDKWVGSSRKLGE